MDSSDEKTLMESLDPVIVELLKENVRLRGEIDRLKERLDNKKRTKTSHRTADGNIPSHVAIENLKRLCGWLEMPSRCGARRYGCTSQSVRKAIAGR